MRWQFWIYCFLQNCGLNCHLISYVKCYDIYRKFCASGSSTQLLSTSRCNPLAYLSAISSVHIWRMLHLSLPHEAHFSQSGLLRITATKWLATHHSYAGRYCSTWVVSSSRRNSVAPIYICTQGAIRLHFSSIILALFSRLWMPASFCC